MVPGQRGGEAPEQLEGNGSASSWTAASSPPERRDSSAARGQCRRRKKSAARKEKDDVKLRSKWLQRRCEAAANKAGGVPPPVLGRVLACCGRFLELLRPEGAALVERLREREAAAELVRWTSPSSGKAKRIRASSPTSSDRCSDGDGAP